MLYADIYRIGYFDSLLCFLFLLLIINQLLPTINQPLTINY